MVDLIIVGGGTAGLSAAIYGVRAGKSVLVLEEKFYGGQIVNSPEVVNYPGIPKISGFEFAKNLYEQAIALGAEYKQARVVQIRQKETDRVSQEEEQSVTSGPSSIKQVVVRTGDSVEECYEASAVILATGAKNRPLGLEREQELIGAGISYCATCDGMFFRDREVAVAGGGNTALEDALFLAEYCSKVYLIHRRDQFRGEEKLVERLRGKERVEFVLESEVIRLHGDAMLDQITVRHVKTGEQRDIAVSALFVAIGQMPDNGNFSDLVSVDAKGYIRAGEDCRTDTPGIYTAGDCRTKEVRQLATAAADGAVAALAACEYIG